MSTKRPDDTSLDDWLKRAFADDLPGDAAAGMRARLARFRAGTMGEKAPAKAWGWLSRKRAWAALSVLMLVSGGLLQGLGSRNALADRISSLLVLESGREAQPPVAPPAPARKPGRGEAASIRDEIPAAADKEGRP